MIEQTVLESLKKYCAYRERCHQELRYKLISLRIYGDELEEYISLLIREGFLNEERFARSYARGKHNINKWGWIKIKSELKKREISDYCIRKAKEEIDEYTYKDNLSIILKKYLDYKGGEIDPGRKLAAKRYTMSKGYESGLIDEMLRKLID